MARIVVESKENGPYLVIVDGKPLASICRCGLSSSKPLCDGTHERSGLNAPASTKIEAESPVTSASTIKQKLPITEATVTKGGCPVDAGLATKSRLPFSLPSVVRAEPPAKEATADGELVRTTGVSVETRNVCESCGHVNPEWVRHYCVRCAARLRTA